MDAYSRQILGKLRDGLDKLDFRIPLALLTADGKEGIDWERIELAGDELARLKICGMAAEIYDYVGDYDSARVQVDEDGRESEKILRNYSPQQENDRILLKQRVWILIHWASTFYRTHQYRKARQLLMLCDEALHSKIISDNDPCFWTQSRIYYSLGLVQRQVYDYKSARHWFTKSIELAAQSFAQRTEVLTSTHPLYQRNKKLTSFYIAKSLALGLAWTYYTEGALELASSLVNTSRHLMADSGEVVIRSYIEILSASILASQGKRQEAIKIFESAYSTLEEHGHAAYRIRAAHELAVAYVHEYVREPTSENLTFAQRYINEVKRSSDVRWECNALITESRLLRAMGEFQAAEESAMKALELGGKQRFIRIDAHIACGEARLELNRIDEACQDFTIAQGEGLDNRKVQAVCHLHLARAYARKGDQNRALHHHEEATRNVAHVDNAFVQSLAKTVDRLIERDDFYIPFSSQKLQPWLWEKRLHGFLADWAKHRAGIEGEPWKLLGISKQTFYNWKLEGDSVREQPLTHE